MTGAAGMRQRSSPRVCACRVASIAALKATMNISQPMVRRPDARAHRAVPLLQWSSGRKVGENRPSFPPASVPQIVWQSTLPRPMKTSNPRLRCRRSVRQPVRPPPAAMAMKVAAVRPEEFHRSSRRHAKDRDVIHRLWISRPAVIRAGRPDARKRNRSRTIEWTNPVRVRRSPACEASPPANAG